jgi:putative flippase GtrA
LNHIHLRLASANPPLANRSDHRHNWKATPYQQYKHKNAYIVITRLILHLKSHQLGRFAVIGAIVTLTDLLCFYVLMTHDLPAIAAHIISYCLVYPAHYLLNRHYTFQQKGPIILKRALFGWGIGFLTLGLSTLTLWSFIQFLPPMIAKIVTTLVIFVLNFLINKHVIFKTFRLS